MRKSVAVPLLAIGLLLVFAVPGRAWHGNHPGVRTRVFVGGVGPAFWWGPPYPYWSYPYWWHDPPYYMYAPPPVVVETPPVYVQQEPAPAPPPQTYWYYCPSANAYYPNAQTCPEAWIKVPPRPQ